MSLVDMLFISSAWVASAVRYANTSGTPLTSAAAAGTGEALSDVYGLALSSVSGGSGTVTVSTTAPNNPFAGRVVAGVLLDGSTVYRNIIPGVALVFSNTGANGNTATVYVGQYLGTLDAFGAGAGVPTTAVKHRVFNDGTGAVSNCLVGLRTQAIHVRKTGRVFNYVRPFAVGATQKTAGGGSNRTMPYSIDIINVSGAGGSKICDLRVDGATLGAATILDITNSTNVSGAGLKAISPPYPYRIISGPLTGVEFAIDSTVANGDTANILIFPARYIQIAPDVSGSAGTWGTADVVLTQAGQSTGVIAPGGEAFYWVRAVVPSGGDSESNPLPANISLSGTETGAASWLS